jgi:uncharacterized protein (DUF58 family)
MFFRRPKPKVLTFDDRMQQVRDAGFTVTRDGSGRPKVTRGACAAVIEEAAGGAASLVHAGLAIGDEIGVLTDLGFQKVFETPAGIREAATAPQLRELHDFTEDLREALGLTSYYNEGLGTTNERHLYDRVLNRDRGVPRRPWEHS